MKTRKNFALFLLWLAGIATIIGSSLEEDRPPPPPPVPVSVQFELTAPAGLRRKLETRSDEINGLNLFGSYNANRGDTLTLDRNTLSLDINSGFTIVTTADSGTSELLMGQGDIVITAQFDAGLTGNPDTGQFTSDLEGTTTTVTATTSRVDVLVEGGNGVVSYNWSEFEAAEDDESLSLHIRMASAAYNILDTVLVSARVVEDLIDAIEDNKTMLEAMNLDSPLTLTCDNTTTGASLELSWTLDPAGTGQGSVGAGDEFEAVYTNCRTASLNVFLQGRVPLDSYDPDNTSTFETLSIVADFNPLYLSDISIVGSAVPGSESPRFRGKLSVSLEELAISR